MSGIYSRNGFYKLCSPDPQVFLYHLCRGPSFTESVFNNFNQPTIVLTHLDYYPFTSGTFVQCMTAAIASLATVDLDSGFAL